MNYFAVIYLATIGADGYEIKTENWDTQEAANQRAYTLGLEAGNKNVTVVPKQA